MELRTGQSKLEGKEAEEEGQGIIQSKIFMEKKLGQERQKSFRIT